MENANENLNENSPVNDGVDSISDLSFHQRLKKPIYLTFVFIGIGLLWPWNTILSASEYYKHDMFNDTTIWAKIFTSSMMSVSTITSLLFNIWLTKRQFAYSERVVRGLVWEIIVFFSMIFLSFIHRILPKPLKFVVIMILVAITAVGTALTQNGILAIANVYGSEMSQAVMLGQAIAGVLPSFVLFSISLLKSSNEQSLFKINFYLFTTVLVSGICIWLFRSNNVDVVLKTATDQDSSQGYTELSQEDQPEFDKAQIPFSVLFSKLKYLVLSIFLTFTITMVFAVFASTIGAQGLPLSNNQFIPLAFTIWNIGDLCGRFVAELPVLGQSSFTPFKTCLYSLLRIGLVPMFLPFVLLTERFKVVTDLLYLSLQFIFGLTNGHIISMSFMKVPDILQTNKEREAAGGFTNAFVSTGLAAGSLFSFLFVYIIGRISAPET